MKRKAEPAAAYGIVGKAGDNAAIRLLHVPNGIVLGDEWLGGEADA
jgi:hypothetical protein